MWNHIVGLEGKRIYLYQSLLLGVFLFLLIITAGFFYNRMYFGEYKFAHKDVYTNYDYFMDMVDDSSFSESNFKMYMYSAVVSMLGDREVTIDSRILESNIHGCYGLMPIKYTQDDIGVLNGLFQEEEVGCQTYYLPDTNGQVHKLFLFTGEQWEKSSHIKIFCNLEGNVIVAPDKLFNESDFIDAEMKLEAFSCEKVFVQTNKDVTIQRVAGEGHKKEIAIRQLLFMIFIASLGFIAGKPLFEKSGGMAIWFLLPFGFLNQIFSTLLLIILHLKISFLNYIVVSYVVATAFHVYLRKYAGNTKTMVKYHKKQLFNILIWAGVVVWFCIRPYIILSYDSVLNAYYGKYAVVMEDLNAVLDGVSSYSLITPLYEVGSSFFGIELNYSIQPLLTITFMVVMGWIWIKTINSSTKLKIGIIFWGILALIINPMFYIQTFWKLNNLSLGLFIGMTVGMHLLYYITEEKIYFKIGNLFFIVVSIARIESGLFSIIHLVCLFTLFQKKHKEREVKILCFRMAWILTAIYLYYLFTIGQVESPFWTPIKGLAMNILIWVVYLYIHVSTIFYQKAKWIRYNLDRIMLLSICFGILAFGVVDQEKFIHNAFVYICNLGNYGGYWALVMIAVLYGIFFVKKNAVIRFLSIYLIAYFLLIPGLMIFREIPLRIGFGDSACRMLSHIVVIGCYYLIYLVNEVFMGNRIGGNEIV